MEVDYKTRKRTKIDFSKHELNITNNDVVIIHDLKQKDSIEYRVVFINSNDICAVTGDFGNWIFCREFHPSNNGYVSDSYWIEKLKISSTQEPYVWNEELVRKEIVDILKDKENMGYDEIDFWKELMLDSHDGEYAYSAKCMYHPLSIDAEKIPEARQEINPYLLAIFDAFEEVCRRMKEEQIK